MRPYPFAYSYLGLVQITISPNSFKSLNSFMEVNKIVITIQPFSDISKNENPIAKDIGFRHLKPIDT